MQSLQKYHTFGLPVFAREIVKINSFRSLTNFADNLVKNQKICILGNGSNTVFLQNFNGSALIICNKGYKFIPINSTTTLLRAKAGESWSKLAWKSARAGFWGLENLVDIPATVGAAAVQNIGAYGQEFANLVDKVEYYDLVNKKMVTLNVGQCEFGYRDSVFKNPDKFNSGEYVVTSVDLILQNKAQPIINYPDLKNVFQNQKKISPIDIAEKVSQIRAQKIPSFKKFGNAGSFFKNIVVTEKKFNCLYKKFPQISYFNLENQQYKIASGWLIENAGLKGKQVGEVMISPKHALVLGYPKKNIDKGSDKKSTASRDLGELIAIVQKTILEKYGLQIETEVLML